MRQNDQVVSFPLDNASRPLLRDFMGTERDRLNEVVHRLSGIEALLFFAKNAEELPPLVSAMLGGIETAVNDCIVVAELRPVASPAGVMSGHG